MVIEIAEFTVSPENSDSFERAMMEVLPILDRQPGMLRRSFGQALEEHDTYLLLVEWQSLADHVEGFRKSPEFATFTGSFRPLLAKPARMLHIERNDG